MEIEENKIAKLCYTQSNEHGCFEIIKRDISYQNETVVHFSETVDFTTILLKKKMGVINKFNYDEINDEFCAVSAYTWCYTKDVEKYKQLLKNHVKQHLSKIVNNLTKALSSFNADVCDLNRIDVIQASLADNIILLKYVKENYSSLKKTIDSSYVGFLEDLIKSKIKNKI